jgi:hypothetical protein
MIVNKKYKLGALVRSGEVATFEAQEIATGRSCYVHLMSGAPTAASLTAQVRARLAADSGSSAPPLIEQGDYEGAPFVVTEATPELLDLQRWIEAQPAAGSTVADSGGSEPGSPSPASEPTGARKPGEFTRLFQGGGGEETSAAGPPPVAPSSLRPKESAPAAATGSELNSDSAPLAAQPPIQAPQAPRQGPGEFTRMFATTEVPADQETSPATPTAPASPPPGRTEAGRDLPSPAGPTAAGGAKGGEFTRMFQAGQEGEPTAGSDPAGGPRPARKEPPAPKGVPPPRSGMPGELGPPAAPEVADRPPGKGEFTQLFQDSQGLGKSEVRAEPPETSPTPREELAPEPPAVPRTPQRTPQEPIGGSPAAQPASGPAQPAKGAQQARTGQTGEFTKLFREGPPPSDRQKPASPPQVAEPSVTDSGTFRKVSPQERRQEMRQFRLVSHPGGEPPRPAPGAESRPVGPVDKPPAVEPPQPSAGSSHEPGEFTRLFQGGPQAGTPDSPPLRPQGPLAQAPPAGAPDRRSATQLGGPSSAPPGGAPLAPQQPGDPTWRAQQEAGPKPSPQAPFPPPAAVPPASGRPSGPGAYGGEPHKVDQTGEFTKLFREGKPSSGRHEPAPPPAPQAPPAASPDPGEFTRLFGSGQSAPTEPDPWGGRQHSPPPRASEAGDFTRIFGGGGSSGPQGGDPFSGGSSWPPDSQRQTLEPEDQPGAFTKMFGGRSSQGPEGAANWRETPHDPRGATQISRDPSPPPQAPPPPPVQGPSDFTRLMGNAPPPPRQQAPPEQQAPVQPVPPPAAPPAYPAAPPAYAAPPVAAAPPAAPAPPVAAQPAAAAPQPARRQPERGPANDRSTYLILALVFCALLVVALGIVLFVSLTGDRGGQPAQGEVQTQQEAPQAPAANPGYRVNRSTSVPGIRQPSVTSPSLRAPSVRAPSVSRSGISSGSVTAPSVSGPRVSAPSVSSPRLPTVPRASSGQIPSASAAPQSSGQPAAAETGGTPYLALIIILSILLVIAVGAAVYYALRRA